MIRVLHKATDIMKYLATTPYRCKNLHEITGHLKMNAGTCANIMKTMIQCGLVDQKKARGGYMLGPMIYYLARTSAYRVDLAGTAEPLMADLVRQVNETVMLIVLHGTKRSIIIQINGNQSVQIGHALFQNDRVYQTASGRLLLAHLNENALKLFIAEEGLPGPNWPEAASLPKLQKALEIIRRKGWERHKTQDDVIAIAYPIHENSKVIAALGMFLPSFRFKGTHKAAVIQGMAATSAAISGKLSSLGSNHPKNINQGEPERWMQKK